MPLYEDQFSEELDFPEVEKGRRVLVVASTPRCGSHMLGHALHQTGCFGFPLEYANPANLREWRSRLGLSEIGSVMEELQKRRTSPNGVFGIKLHYSHIHQFGGFSKLMETFPDARFVLLSRKNVLGQAVSLAIARQTGVWISGQKPRMTNPEYRFEEIDHCLRQTILHTASWRYTLASSGARFIEIDFDEVRQDLASSVETISDFMGIVVPESSIPTQQVTKKQTDDLKKEWAERFLSEFDSRRELMRGGDPHLLGKVRSVLRRARRRLSL